MLLRDNWQRVTMARMAWGACSWIVVALGCALILGSARPAAADIYRRVDADGIVYLTNVAPSGGQTAEWQRVLREDPDANTKVAARRGRCERCDTVPAQDTSPDRFHRYDHFIAEAAALYEIPPALIRAVIKVESDYDPRVISSMDARGLMQLMPLVSQEMGVQDVFDPRENILGGTRLLRILANRYDGDILLTIAGYHAGMGSLAKYGDTVPPYRRTRRYVHSVLEHYQRYKELAYAPQHAAR